MSKILRRVFFLLGVGLFIGGIVSAWRQQQFIDHAIRVPGVVIENVKEEDEEGPSYHVRFEFQPLQGGNIRVTSHIGSNPPAYNVGDRLEVLYPVNNPAGAKVNAFWHLWFVPVLLSSMGIILATIGAFGGNRDQHVRVH